MKSRTVRTIGIVVVLLFGAPGVVPGARAASAAKTYRPPYKLGPAGGDGSNIVYRDETTGRIAIGRAFRGVPPVVGCFPEPSAGWATFHISHKTPRTISSVALEFDAAMEPYSWITLGARTKSGWLGVKKFQGPFLGENEQLVLRLGSSPRPGQQLTIEFGLQLGDGCPQVGGAMAEFSSVSVRWQSPG